MYRLCNNPVEWQEPEKFIPDRFDTQSPMFLTPSGKKRNPYSFSPFLGGKRICLGKTFVETVSKLVLPALWANFNFEFEPGVDPKTYKMPANNLACMREPDITLIVSKKEQHVPFITI